MMFGLMAVWFLIDSLVFPLQVLGFLLTSLSISGEVVGGVTWMEFELTLILIGRPAEVFVLFLGLFNLFRGLKCVRVILALQSSRAVHLGVDNLGVVRHVGRLLDGCRGPVLFELVNDGDLLMLIQRMLNRRGLDTVRISKAQGSC